MAPKGLLLFNIIPNYLIISVMLFLGSCVNDVNETKLIIEKVDVSKIPVKYVNIQSLDLKLNNGIYYFRQKPFSGYIQENYLNGLVKATYSYYKGEQHGVSKTYFSNGKLKDSRMYKNNRSYGRHFGFWENGNIKFDFIYYNDKREGLQKQWYESGMPYYTLNFRDDREDGMQQAWRQTGRPYINYEVKDGKRYGLQKSNLCYTLINGDFKK